MNRLRGRIGDRRDILIYGLHGLEQGKQRLRRGRLDDKPLVSLARHRVFVPKRERLREADGPAVAFFEDLHAAFGCNGSLCRGRGP